MQFGVTLPNLGVRADPRTLAELAADAERAGWDGILRGRQGITESELVGAVEGRME